jgi:hypothetical protein
MADRANSGEWRTTVNAFSPSADIRSQVFDGDEIICADLMHVEADQIVKAHNQVVRQLSATLSYSTAKNSLQVNVARSSAVP